MSLPPPLQHAVVPPAVSEVLEQLTRAGYRAFLVGGCVRDMVRGAQPKDFDLATSAVPTQVQQVFKKVIPTGIQHGTVTVLMKGLQIEVTTFRSEGEYVDGRRPETVSFETDIAIDLSRRDFTINAMAFDPVAKELVDPFDGQADLAAKIIRCVRSPIERFTEDGLRAMRAVRFATVLDFTIEPKTLEAIALTLPTFQKLAMERVREELQKLLLSPHASKGVALLEQTKLLATILPEVKQVDAAAVGRAPATLPARLGALLWNASPLEPALTRLKLPSKELAEIRHALINRTLPPVDATDATVRRWLAKVTVEAFPLILDLAQASGQDVAQTRAHIDGVLQTHPPLTSKALALDGKGLMDALGVKPGAIVGQASRFLLEHVLDHPESNTPERLRALLAGWAPPTL